jgi:hypothetical protein
MFKPKYDPALLQSTMRRRRVGERQARRILAALDAGRPPPSKDTGRPQLVTERDRQQALQRAQQALGGRQLTVDEEAAVLGVSSRTAARYRSRYGGNDDGQ